VFAPNKKILIEKRVATTIILVKINVAVKEFFELVQFFVEELFYLLLSVRLFGFDFINGVIINEL
jgi:hypothetical protein